MTIFAISLGDIALIFMTLFAISLSDIALTVTTLIALIRMAMAKQQNSMQKADWRNIISLTCFSFISKRIIKTKSSN